MRLRTREQTSNAAVECSPAAGHRPQGQVHAVDHDDLSRAARSHHTGRSRKNNNLPIYKLQSVLTPEREKNQSVTHTPIVSPQQKNNAGGGSCRTSPGREPTPVEDETWNHPHTSTLIAPPPSPSPSTHTSLFITEDAAPPSGGRGSSCRSSSCSSASPAASGAGLSRSHPWRDAERRGSGGGSPHWINLWPRHWSGWRPGGAAASSGAAAASGRTRTHTAVSRRWRARKYARSKRCH
ncbi:unnamed protein product [Pleuronectes platessa]|uniref:Uncharacterized protein n=1 Tax=Pleuronectes platessa TaxID=8262 RepID=A0A9N7UN76_PLEPL|nr:unnamed protein product [Pleuronectes platessa]